MTQSNNLTWIVNVQVFIVCCGYLAVLGIFGVGVNCVAIYLYTRYKTVSYSYIYIYIYIHYI